MPKFINKGLPNFKNKVASRNGEILSRENDLVFHLRSRSGEMDDVSYSPNNIVPAGDLSSALFSPRPIENMPSAIFNGSTTRMVISGSVNTKDLPSMTITLGNGSNDTTLPANGEILTITTNSKTLKVKFSTSNTSSNSAFIAGGNSSGTCEQNIYVHASQENTIPKIAAKLRAALAALTTTTVNGVTLAGYTISAVGGAEGARTITLTGHDQPHNFTFAESADSNSVYSATSLLWRTGSLLPINGRSIMVSGWLNVDMPMTSSGQSIMQQNTVANVGGTGADENLRPAFGIFINGSEQLGIRFHDPIARNEFVDSFTTEKFPSGSWHHFAITVDSFDDSGTPTSQTDKDIEITAVEAANINIYVDGKWKAKTVQHGTLSSAKFSFRSEYTPSGSLLIGNGLGNYDSGTWQENTWYNGSMAELAFWRGTSPFTSTDARLTYEAHQNLGSGYLSLPPRILLNKTDENHRHPVSSDTGDLRRTGTHRSFFDDTKPPSLHVNDVSYPFLINSSDSLLQKDSNNIYQAGNFKNIVDGQLTVSRTPSSEVYEENYYADVDAKPYDPFDEARVYIGSSSFYMTGTINSVLPGFSAPLRDKSIITIEGTNTSQVDLGGVSNKSTSSDPFSVMAYFDFSNQAFKPFGKHTLHGSTNQANVTIAYNNFTSSCQTFFHPPQVLTSSGYATSHLGSWVDQDDFDALNAVNLLKLPDDFYTAYGMPSDVYGFPDDQRYDPPNGALIKMSDYITGPFLVEKVVFDFDAVQVDGAVGDGLRLIVEKVEGGGSTSNGEVEISQGFETLNCFLLRHYSGSVSGEISVKVGRNYQGNQMYANVTHPITGSMLRDIITYGKAGFADSTIVTHPNKMDTPPVPLTYFASSSISNLLHFITSSFSNFDKWYFGPFGSINEHAVKIETTPKLIPQSSFTGLGEIMGGHNKTMPAGMSYTSASVASFPSTHTGNIFHKWTGGPNNITKIQTSRLVGPSISGVSNRQEVKNYITTTLIAGANTTLDFEISKQQNPQSTYVLMPEDEIVFGVQSNGVNDSTTHNTGIRFPANTKFKIHLFGSYLQNTLPFNGGLNQLLNNHVVHQSIGDQKVLDQFDVNYSDGFGGSYVDEVMSGSTTGPLYSGWCYKPGKDSFGTTENLARRVGVRFSSGETREMDTGYGIIPNNYGRSLRRTVAHNSERLRYYDSVVPDYAGMVRTDINVFGSSGPTMTGAEVALQFENTFSKGKITLGNRYPQQPFNFPFESRYGAVTRQETITGLDGSVFDIDNKSVTIRQSGEPGAFFHLQFSQHSKGADFHNRPLQIMEFPRNEAFVGDWQNDPARGINLNVAMPIPLTNAELLSLLYGIGEGPRGKHVITGPTVGGGDQHGRYKIRGTKYGLINYRPQFAKNVFRRDRYGNLRDMLEQAPNAVYIHPQTSTVSYPVEARFFDRDGSVVRASSTACSNLSTHMTSSAPFFDRDPESDDLTNPLIIRNRGLVEDKFIDLTIEL